MAEEGNRYFCAQLWEQGRKEINQDSLGFWWMKKGRKNRFLAIVCDGIGGLQEGENASTHVVRQMISWYMAEGYKKRKNKKLKCELQQLFYQIHEELKSYGRKEKKQLGTTVTFFLGFDEKFLWGHCGDSRLYHLKKGRVQLLTKDDKFSDGSLYKAIGCGAWQLLKMGEGRLKKEEKLLLCTDGFYRGIEKNEWMALGKRKITDDETAERMLYQFLQKKKEMGECDNISALFFGRTIKKVR